MLLKFSCVNRMLQEWKAWEWISDEFYITHDESNIKISHLEFHDVYEFELDRYFAAIHHHWPIFVSGLDTAAPDAKSNMALKMDA